jgi:pSer/pThr/pTyr-binding forkhead associated (FHA) protein
VVRTPELHERIWPGTFVSDATLISLVKEIRRALDDRDVQAPIIRTAHGVGAGVSRRHARSVVDDSDALLEDVGSKNGTSLEEQPVTGPTALQDGDWVHIGPIAIMYRASATGISTETVSKRRPQSRGTTKAD